MNLRPHICYFIFDEGSRRLSKSDEFTPTGTFPETFCHQHARWLWILQRFCCCIGLTWTFSRNVTSGLTRQVLENVKSNVWLTLAFSHTAPSENFRKMSLSILYMVGAFTFGRFSFQPVLKIRSKSEPLSNSLDKNANKSKVKEKIYTLIVMSMQFSWDSLRLFYFWWNKACCFLIGQEGEDFSKRPASEPVNPNYDYPRSYSTETQVRLQYFIIFIVIESIFLIDQLIEGRKRLLRFLTVGS